MAKCILDFGSYFKIDLFSSSATHSVTTAICFLTFGLEINTYNYNLSFGYFNSIFRFNLEMWEVTRLWPELP
jgi:hypothetical protein